MKHLHTWLWYLATDPGVVRACLVAAVLATCVTPLVSADSAEAKLEDILFWRTSAGFWVSDNTYFNQSLDYNIRSYNSIVQVELEGRSFRETEYKFYPPGKMATGYGAGQVMPDEGIEVVTVTEGEMADDRGSVSISSISPGFGGQWINRIDVLTDDTAVRVTSHPGGSTDSYRMFITMPAADRRYVVNFGLVDKADGEAGQPGDLRGFSLFRGRRIGREAFEDTRERLRQINRVAALATADAEGRPQVQRLKPGERAD